MAIELPSNIMMSVYSKGAGRDDGITAVPLIWSVLEQSLNVREYLIRP